MTLRNRAQHHQPAPAPKPSRPRLPRGPKASGRGLDFPSHPMRERTDQPPSLAAAPPAMRASDAGPSRTPAEIPSNGSPGGPSRPTLGNRIASRKPYHRDKTRTLTVKDAAYLLNRSEDTVYQWLRLGRLRGWQLGGRRCAVMVCEESVEEALAGSFGSDGALHSA